MILKEATNITLFRKHLIYTKAARIGFRMILHSLKLKSSDKILLPGYIGISDREGSGVFDPIVELKLGYDFYHVDLHLSADIDEIREKFENGNIRVLLIIHYFGMVQNDLHSIRAICNEYNVVLIEDCAHAWCSSWDGIELGCYGDFSFSSIHKYLPVEDGGFFNWKSKTNIFNLPSDEEKISFQSLEITASSDFKRIAQTRLDNYNYLVDLIKNFQEIKIMYPKLDKGIIPLNFPISIKGGKREKVYFALIEKNINTFALYYRLIPQIDKDQFPVSYQISHSILNLPIHQDITKEDLSYMHQELSKLIR